MIVRASAGGLKQTKWHEYAARFLFGGVMTVVASLIAKHFGPVIGGLFLAFPAIFPASATLINKHEKERKEQKGMEPGCRGRHAAGADAAGTAMGSIGLALFAAVVWIFLPRASGWVVLPAALASWMLACAAVWLLWKKRLLRVRQLRSAPPEPSSCSRTQCSSPPRIPHPSAAPAQAHNPGRSPDRARPR